MFNNLDELVEIKGSIFLKLGKSLLISFLAEFWTIHELKSSKL